MHVLHNCQFVLDDCDNLRGKKIRSFNLTHHCQGFYMSKSGSKVELKSPTLTQVKIEKKENAIAALA